MPGGESRQQGGQRPRPADAPNPDPGPASQPDTPGEQHDRGDTPPTGNVGRTQPYEEAQTIDEAVGPTDEHGRGR